MYRQDFCGIFWHFSLYVFKEYLYNTIQCCVRLGCEITDYFESPSNMAQKYAAKNLNVQCMMACLVAPLEFQLHILLRGDIHITLGEIYI